jgi:hypothetical protein
MANVRPLRCLDPLRGPALSLPELWPRPPHLGDLAWQRVSFAVLALPVLAAEAHGGSGNPQAEDDDP